MWVKAGHCIGMQLPMYLSAKPLKTGRILGTSPIAVKRYLGFPIMQDRVLNGDLLLTTNDETSGDTYSIVVWATKGYTNPS